eukprot:GHVP01044009.1.p1 GENE.GHVP01044009.1~~GHVP01044009.1.p1  ORF type:complete len:176 (+),score=38.03 GHVP01044009.1:278-805(+)
MLWMKDVLREGARKAELNKSEAAKSRAEPELASRTRKLIQEETPVPVPNHSETSTNALYPPRRSSIGENYDPSSRRSSISRADEYNIGLLVSKFLENKSRKTRMVGWNIDDDEALVRARIEGQISRSATVWRFVVQRLSEIGIKVPVEKMQARWTALNGGRLLWGTPELKKLNSG